jgi:hypothetical protein
MKTFVISFILLLIGLSFTANANAQNRKPKLKMARGFVVEISDGNKMGTTCIDTKQGKRCFTTCFNKDWCGGVTKYTGFKNKNANSIGAEYIIYYSGDGDNASANEIIFTGKSKKK